MREWRNSIRSFLCGGRSEEKGQFTPNHTKPAVWNLMGCGGIDSTNEVLRLHRGKGGKSIATAVHKKPTTKQEKTRCVGDKRSQTRFQGLGQPKGGVNLENMVLNSHIILQKEERKENPRETNKSMKRIGSDKRFQGNITGPPEGAKRPTKVQRRGEGGNGE